MPNTAALLRRGSLRRMSSVYPWVSSVAWSTFMTGVNPAKHAIFGFIDRDPATHRTFIPVASHMRAPTLWELLSRAGKRVIVINVPVTYPVDSKPDVNGIMIGDFLSPRLNERSVRPASLLPTLQQLGYRIDADPWLAHSSLEKAFEDILDALAKRATAMLYLLDREPWDFFMAVIMETDRLHHFYFALMEQGDPTWAPRFREFYAAVDEIIGQVVSRLDEHTTLLMMSDHGFCTIRQEVYYNHWLAEAGYLKYARPVEQIKGPDLSAVDGSSLAFSMDPGRIFVNLRGRELNGSVSPAGYERVRDELVTAAEALVDPATGVKLVQKAFRREEIYRGPYLSQAADIILAPTNGYDPKGALYRDSFFHKDAALAGMHTFEDAMLYVADQYLPEREVSILDVMPTILRLMGVPPPADLDGQPLI